MIPQDRYVTVSTQPPVGSYPFTDLLTDIEYCIIARMHGQASTNSLQPNQHPGIQAGALHNLTGVSQ